MNYLFHGSKFRARSNVSTTLAVVFVFSIYVHNIVARGFSTTSTPHDILSLSEYDHSTVSSLSSLNSSLRNALEKEQDGNVGHATIQKRVHESKEEESMIGIDEYGRRFFPKKQKLPEEYISHTTFSNCTKFSDLAGCIAVPSSNPTLAYTWVGTLYSVPPKCNVYEDLKKQCDLGIPVSRKIHSIAEYISPVKEHLFQDEAVNLPGCAVYTASIAIADVNNDGFPDIILANRNEKNQILINDGSGKFDTAVDLPGGTYDTRSIVVADLNNDGWDDIVVGNYRASNQILLNYNNGNFKSVIDLPDEPTSHTTSLAVLDIDKDGKVDIAVGNHAERNQLLKNEGDGFFIVSSFGNRTSRTTAISAADCNNDGFTDIIVANFAENNELFLNDRGGGVFDESVELPNSGQQTLSVAVEDVNSDGNIDFVFGNNKGQGDQILMNNGTDVNGTFTFEIIHLHGSNESSTQAIALIDVNEDGQLDIIAGRASRQQNLIYFLDDTEDDGLLSVKGTKSLGISLGATTLAGADVNKDGVMEIVFGNFGRVNQMFIQVGGGIHPFPLTGGNSFGYTTLLVAADFNNDGFMDLVVGNFREKNQILFNDGHGNYYTAKELPGGKRSTFSLAAADLDDNGAMDIIIGNYNDFNQILMNDGLGNFEAKSLVGGKLSTNSIAIIDYDNNGALDIVVGNYRQANYLLINDGHGTFIDPFLLPGGNQNTAAVAVADVDNDGWMDIIVGNNAQKNQLLINNKEGNFIAVDMSSEMLRTRAVAVADMDGENGVDIIIGNDNTDNQIFFNDGLGNFREAVHLQGEPTVAVADFNNDGLLDVFFGGSTNQLLLNKGDKSFRPITGILKNDISTTSVIPVDVDNDNMIDFVIGQKNGKNKIILNQGYANDFKTNDLPEDGLSRSVSIATSDFNNDGAVDLFIGNYDGSYQLLSYDKVKENFQSLNVSLPGGPTWVRAVVAADFDNDGLIDIAVGNSNQQNKILFNHDEEVAKFKNRTLFLPGGSDNDTYALAVADVDQDGFPDVIVGNWNANNQLLKNDGKGGFNKVVDLPGFSKSFTRALAVADVDNDHKIDIVVINQRQAHQVLINDGKGNFDKVITLPMTPSLRTTTSVAVADIDNDGRVDILLGNDGQSNQVLRNRGNYSFELYDILQNDNSNTMSLVVADFNNDGLVDLVVGNKEGQSNQIFMNSENGSWKEIIDIPNSDEVYSWSLATADTNQDGFLEIISGNILQKNQISYVTTCNNGGAMFHPKSWCFGCPSFMGKQSQLSIGSKCVECQSDFMQRLGEEEQCGHFCSLQNRTIGKDTCTNCPAGHYYDSTVVRDEHDPSTWNKNRCVACNSGEYANLDIVAVDKCFKCQPGTYQDLNTSSACLNCPNGTYQTKFGQDRCEVCKEGGYCNSKSTIDGGFNACTPGTYNNQTAQSDVAACTLCPKGTFNSESGSTTFSSCRNCPNGTYNDLTGQSECKLCEKGKFQSNSGQWSCHSCANGTYSDNTGLKKCIDCPYRLTSMDGDSLCSICAEHFYLKDVESSATEIFENPSHHCLLCPKNAICPSNTNIQNLTITKDFWRHSLNTSKVYPCQSNGTCVGSGGNIVEYSHMDLSSMYCLDGYKGPLCEVCTSSSNYFDAQKRRCFPCPSILILVLQISGWVAGAMIGLTIILFAYKKKSLNFISSLGLQAKGKLLISFYQIIVSFEDVYGVSLSTHMVGHLNFFKYLALDMLDFFPFDCVASVQAQLVVKTMWPFIIIIMGICAMVFCNFLIKICQRALFLQRYTAKSVMFDKNAMVQASIITVYFAFPLVARGLFDVFRCRPFQTDDTPTFVSYLIMDLNHICDAEKDQAYAALLRLFWAFFTIWIIIIPLGFFIMLRAASASIQSNSIKGLADHCRFLWEDYDASVWYWDLADTARRVFLTGLIMFIDRNEGSNRLIRLVVAIVVSILFLCVLLAFHPYKRRDNYITALVSNFVLICCFTLGILLKLCDEQDSEIETCKIFIGQQFDSKNTSELVVALTLGMLVLNIGSVAFLTAKSIGASTVTIKSTGYKPNLELDGSCSHHLFMSHIWSTGQAQTHAIVRQLQLMLPGIKIWLDVDELDDISELENCIKTSAMFVLFYSKHYFESRNCRREIYAAISLGKPIIVIYEGDERVLDELKTECMVNCESPNNSDGAEILQNIFESGTNSHQNHGLCTRDDNLIMWLKEGNHSAAALERICLLLFKNLPHYQRHPQELDRGIFVPGEIGSVHLQSSITIIVDDKNAGSRELADELLLAQSDTRRRTMTQPLYSLRSSISAIRIVEYETSLLSVENIDSASAHNNDEETDSLTTEKYQPLPKDRPTFFLLYLNKNTFQHKIDEDRNNCIKMIKNCLASGIKIVLVQEKDPSKGGCDFDVFLSQAPKEIIKPPISLFNQIAIPLYTRKDYRKVSLKQILCKVGAISSGKVKKKCWRM